MTPLFGDMQVEHAKLHFKNNPRNSPEIDSESRLSSLFSNRNVDSRSDRTVGCHGV